MYCCFVEEMQLLTLSLLIVICNTIDRQALCFFAYVITRSIGIDYRHIEIFDLYLKKTRCSQRRENVY